MGSSYSVPVVKSKYFDGFTASLPSMEGKWVVITGTTTGLGLVAAKVCAAKGANLILLNRSSDRATAALETVKAAAPDPAKVVQVPCDLQDFASVRKAAADVRELLKGSGGLNVLANNAGVMAMPDKATGDGYDVQMQTNHLSHFLLTRELMPELERAAARSGEARVVNHSSAARKTPGSKLDAKALGKNGGNLGGDGARWERYHQSKLANMVFTFALQDRLTAAGSKVIAAVCTPGLAASNLQATTADQGGGFGLGLLMKLAQSAEDGTLPLLQCMCGEGVSAGAFVMPGVSGVMDKLVGWMVEFTYGTPKEFKPEALCTAQESKDLLWAESEKAVGAFKVGGAL